MTADGFDPHRAIPGTTHATPEQQHAWAEQQATQIADAVFPAGGGVVSTPNDTRPIWLTRQQRDALRGGPSAWLPVQEITAAWDAAPADTSEAVSKVLAFFHDQTDTDAFTEEALAVLVALGMPRAADPGGRAAPPPTTTTTP